MLSHAGRASSLVPGTPGTRRHDPAPTRARRVSPPLKLHRPPARANVARPARRLPAATRCAPSRAAPSAARDLFQDTSASSPPSGDQRVGSSSNARLARQPRCDAAAGASRPDAATCAAFRRRRSSTWPRATCFRTSLLLLHEAAVLELVPATATATCSRSPTRASPANPRRSCGGPRAQKRRATCAFFPAAPLPARRSHTPAQPLHPGGARLVSGQVRFASMKRRP